MANQLSRSPLCEGSSVVVALAGLERFHDPLTVRLNACPVFDVGGAKSKVPRTNAWSLSREPGIPPTRDGTDDRLRMLKRRDTESAAMPAALRPSTSVLSKL